MRGDAGPIRREVIWTYDGKSIFATPSLALPCAATPVPACARSIPTQRIVLQRFLLLRSRSFPSSLSPCGAIRAQTKVRWWRDREQQQPRKSAWSSIRPVASLPLHHHQDQTLAWSGWFASWRGKLLATSSKKKPTAGSVTDPRSEEVGP